MHYQFKVHIQQKSTLSAKALKDIKLTFVLLTQQVKKK